MTASQCSRSRAETNSPSVWTWTEDRSWPACRSSRRSDCASSADPRAINSFMDMCVIRSVAKEGAEFVQIVYTTFSREQQCAASHRGSEPDEGLGGHRPPGGGTPRTA